MMYTVVRTDEIVFGVNLFDVRNAFTNLVLDDGGLSALGII